MVAEVGPLFETLLTAGVLGEGMLLKENGSVEDLIIAARTSQPLASVSMRGLFLATQNPKQEYFVYDHPPPPPIVKVTYCSRSLTTMLSTLTVYYHQSVIKLCFKQ